jgi:putative ABC transport system substrate-binding protein
MRSLVAGFIGFPTVGASLGTLALQLVNLRPTVIVADTTQSARALKSLTTTIPLIMIADDPVASGFTSNLARPDGNITGLSSVAAELGVKQLQLLTSAARVAVWGITKRA